MKLIKLLFNFNKYLYPVDNPLPKKYLILPFLVLGVFLASVYSYKFTAVAERIEFLSFSPLFFPAGKLNSLAYFSALEGDLDLGIYFHELSLEYSLEPVPADDELIKLIYPNVELERTSANIEKLLVTFPTSRDLYILQAKYAIEMENESAYKESVDKLQLIDPNNQFVLGIIDGEK
jgi:hypothetical protein